MSTAIEEIIQEGQKMIENIGEDANDLKNATYISDVVQIANILNKHKYEFTSYYKILAYYFSENLILQCVASGNPMGHDEYMIRVIIDILNYISPNESYPSEMINDLLLISFYTKNYTNDILITVSENIEKLDDCFNVSLNMSLCGFLISLMTRSL
jgi:hypothetical protein